MDDSKPKRKNHPSRILQHWHSLQIRSLRICIALFIAMTIHGALLLIARHIASDEFTLYIYNSFHLFLILLGALVVFTIVHVTYRFKQGALLLIGVMVYSVLWLLLPASIFWTNWHFDTQRLDDHIYHLSGEYIGSTTISWGPGGRLEHPMVREFRLYTCDSLGLICQMVYRDRQLDEWYSPSAYLRVDATNHRISVVVLNEIIYTYPEGDS